MYKCRNRFDNLIYAVKVLNNNIRNAQNEAQALASLNLMYESSHIVRYFSSWEEGKNVYIVMEMCNQNLDQLNRKTKRFSEETIRKIIKHVSKALSKLHVDNVVHLDIKPENILIGASEKFKISDLGLLKKLDNENDAKTITEGDARYMAKELLNEYSFADIQKKTVDLTKADIFSLGIAIFELLVQDRLSLPKNGELWHSLRNNQLSILDSVEDYSESLKRLVSKMMSKDPANRPSAKEILIDYLLYDEKQAKITLLQEKLKKLKTQLD